MADCTATTENAMGEPMGCVRERGHRTRHVNGGTYWTTSGPACPNTVSGKDGLLHFCDKDAGHRGTCKAR